MITKSWLVSWAGLAVIMVMSLAASPALPAEGPAPGSTIPPFQLKLPDSPEAGAYLGLKGVKTFSLSQVKTKLLVADIFSVYCPVCQKNAPLVNQLFKIIQEDPNLNKNIKLLGISLEKEPSELTVYKQKFKVEFPLVLGPEQAIKKSFKFLPVLLVLDQNGKILMSHAGEMKSLKPILLELRKHNKTISKQ
jgi:thiol-disulfide isomerase/thioredoxin